ncbi:MAG: DUF5666 domain-containing protein [Patescibacteria group bacterium]|nr:DUF5666 domain-containing protein [Patescibacteria group bacterium]
MRKSPYLAGILVASAIILPSAVAQAATTPGYQTNKPVIQKAVHKIRVARATLNAVKNNHAFLGKVTAISGSSLTLQTKARGTLTVNTDSNTAYKLNGNSASLSEIAVGDTIVVRGTWDKTSDTLTAKTVNISPSMVTSLARMHSRMNSLKGTISSIADNSVTINGKNGKTYAVDMTNAKVYNKSGSISSLQSISVGDSVRIKGLRANASGNWIIDSLKDLSK